MISEGTKVAQLTTESCKKYSSRQNFRYIFLRLKLRFFEKLSLACFLMDFGEIKSNTRKNILIFFVYLRNALIVFFHFDLHTS